MSDRVSDGAQAKAELVVSGAEQITANLTKMCLEQDFLSQITVVTVEVSRGWEAGHNNDGWAGGRGKGRRFCLAPSVVC